MHLGKSAYFLVYLYFKKKNMLSLPRVFYAELLNTGTKPLNPCFFYDPVIGTPR
jgi:hypothetical protein